MLKSYKLLILSFIIPSLSPFALSLASIFCYTGQHYELFFIYSVFNSLIESSITMASINIPGGTLL